MAETQKNDERNEALIEEMLRSSPLMETPSDLRENPVIHRGDEALPAPMTVKEISSAGYVWVFDSRTGDKIPVLYYMVPQKMRQRREDGSFRFTTNDPGIRQGGNIKCMLHPDSENRKYYDELGFRVCKKDNILNPYQLVQHMIKKHPQEWAAIEEERKEKERQEDRELQRMLINLGLRGIKNEEPNIEETMEDKAEILVNQGKVEKFDETTSLELDPIDFSETTSLEPELVQFDGVHDPRTGRELKYFEFWCPHCRTVHRDTSRLGKNHKKKYLKD